VGKGCREGQVGACTALLMPLAEILCVFFLLRWLFVNMLSSGKRTLKNIRGGLEEIKELSDALVKCRTAFLDRAVISTKSTVFQILDDVVKLSTQFQALSSQVSDARR
jgi:hypothetical protein